MLEIITASEKERWNDIVRSFPQYDVYYLYNYTVPFRNYGDGEPLLIYYHDVNGSAINVVMKRNISLDRRFAGLLPQDTYFDLSTPYGYGGFIYNGDVDTHALDKAYTQWCVKNGIICEFVRFHPVLQNSGSVGKSSESLYEVTHIGATVCMDLSSPETIWANLTSKNRNTIRKAQKNEITVTHGKNDMMIASFVELYVSTMKKDNAADYYFFDHEFFAQTISKLGDSCEIFCAVWQGKIIAASIMMLENGKLNYHLSGSDAEYKTMAPGNLLLYEAALWGYHNGCKTFHLGGGLGGREDSLYAFKKSFNRHASSAFLVGKKIFDNDKYGELIDIRKINSNFVQNDSFFPAYRA